MTSYRNDSPVVLLSGGVGGARMARGLAEVCDDLTVIVNVGDDEVIYGLHVSPDLDTVLYTLAKREGPHGWGLADDSFEVMSHLSELGVDTSFRIGDQDLATNLARTSWLHDGKSLSDVTSTLSAMLGLDARLLPATDDRVPTRVRSGTEWMSFQDYFVTRRGEPTVDELEYAGTADARPAPGVLESIAKAAIVIIGPSNPPLSIWPILAIPGIREAVRSAERVVVVSPLIGGQAVKGPAAKVMASLGLAAGNQGVADAYRGLIAELIVHEGDGTDAVDTDATVRTADIRIADTAAAAGLAEFILDPA